MGIMYYKKCQKFVNNNKSFRLKEQHEMDAVFDCIRQCVRTIFRENFDSAFEHLGKIDGHVTQVTNILQNMFVDSPPRHFKGIYNSFKKGQPSQPAIWPVPACGGGQGSIRRSPGF